jgi:glycosyltransferase involved in cell wall biosynthesis
MNIAAVAGSRIPSDTANSMQVMKACQAFAQLGHELTLLVPKLGTWEPGIESFQWPDLAAWYGLSTRFAVERFHSMSRRLFTWQAVRRARALGAELLYVWMPQSAVFGLLARLPVIFEVHIQPSGLMGPTWHRLFARQRGRKRLVCITRAMQMVLERKYGMRMSPGEVVVAPNGVDLERFASLPDPRAARRQLGLPQAPTVACTGHLYAGRGVDLFLTLAEGTPQVHFLWVGGRPKDVSLWQQRAYARELHNVTFTGFIPNQDLPLYQAAADVLLMPYEHSIAGSSGKSDSAEIASPMKMFEYMAAGRAIVTSDLPVIREVLNEESAVFCPPEERQTWQETLVSLLADPARRTALAKRARQDVQRYTWLERARKIMGDF